MTRQVWSLIDFNPFDKILSGNRKTPVKKVRTFLCECKQWKTLEECTMKLKTYSYLTDLILLLGAQYRVHKVTKFSREINCGQPNLSIGSFYRPFRRLWKGNVFNLVRLFTAGVPIPWCNGTSPDPGPFPSFSQSASWDMALVPSFLTLYGIEPHPIQSYWLKSFHVVSVTGDNLISMIGWIDLKQETPMKVNASTQSMLSYHAQ